MFCLHFIEQLVVSGKIRAISSAPYQGRSEVYFFVADPILLLKILIPDPENDENFDP